MFNYKITPLSNAEQWKAELENIPVSVYHMHSYCSSMAKTYKQEIYLLSVKLDKAQLICTYSIREKIAGYKEIYTPYGYGGVVTTGDVDEQLFISFWKKFGEENELVTAYLLNHPEYFFLKKWEWDDLFDYHPVFLLDINQPEEILWKNMRKGHKYEIKQSQKKEELKISFEKTKLSSPAIKLYNQTIKRVNANKNYYFTNKTLEELIFSDNCLIAGIFIEEKLETFVMMLFNKQCAEYFISAASYEGQKHTRLLIWHSINILKDKGINTLHLGGGVNVGDSLEAFKRRFGGVTHTLKTIKTIFSYDKYSLLCQTYNSTKETDGFFPSYWKHEV